MRILRGVVLHQLRTDVLRVLRRLRTRFLQGPLHGRSPDSLRNMSIFGNNRLIFLFSCLRNMSEEEEQPHEFAPCVLCHRYGEVECEDLEEFGVFRCEACGKLFCERCLDIHVEAMGEEEWDRKETIHIPNILVTSSSEEEDEDFVPSSSSSSSPD